MQGTGLKKTTLDKCRIYGKEAVKDPFRNNALALFLFKTEC